MYQRDFNDADFKRVPSHSSSLFPTVFSSLIVNNIYKFYVAACFIINCEINNHFCTRNDNSSAMVPAISCRDKPAPMLLVKCRLPNAIIYERSRGALELKRASNAPAKFTNKIAGTLISLADKFNSDLI